MREFQADETINNRYRVLRKLGSGAMGSVYLCEDCVESRIKVALKILISENLEDQDVWAKGEYEALTRLRHPNLARVHNFGRLEGTKDYFIVSEFIKGIDLYAATDYLNYEEITEIVVQICRALEYIHAQGYVHFDIKPDNILVTRHKTIGLKEGSKVQYDSADFLRSTRGMLEKPVVKLIDFGLAERITGSFNFAIKGTLNYLAPEILNGATPDRRADLYSLGVTIYQIVNRDLPFYQDLVAFGESGAAKRSDLFESSLKKHPEYLRGLILKLIEENPIDRFQSAREVIQFINKDASRAYELETEETRASYFHSPRLVGRKREMNVLKRYYDEIFCKDAGTAAPAPADGGESTVAKAEGTEDGPIDSRARLIVVNGEMGSGKSRLLDEFRHYLKLNNFSVYTGNCYEANQKAYQPILEILRQVVYAAGPDSELVEKHSDIITALLPSLQSSKKSAETPGREAVRLDKERHYFIERVSQLLIDAARATPYLMLVSNLQWIDEVSIDILEKLCTHVIDIAGSGERLKLLVVVCQRAEEQASERLRTLFEALKARDFCLEIQLRRLKHDQIAELVQSTLALADVPDEFVTRLEEQTGGNPLFLVETLKALETSGVIKHEADGWTINSSKLNRVEIPRNMEDLLLGRLNGIDPLKRQLLGLMAVLDKSVNPKFLQSFKRFRDTPVLAPLRDLESSGIISKQFDSGKLVFQIEQAKIRETMYSCLKDDERRQLHGEVVEAYEAAYQNREEEILEELAFHSQRSDRTDKAIKLSLKAGDRLKAIFAHERAYDHYHHVLEHVGNRPECLDLSIEVREKLGDVCSAMGRYEAAAQYFSSLLEDESRDLVSAERLTSIHLRRGKVFEIQGDYDSALKCYKEARNHLSELGADGQFLERARIYNSIGWVYVSTGKYEKAMTISLEALRVVADVPESIEHAMIYSTIGSANFYKGNLGEAVKYHRQSLEIKEHLENIPEITISLNNLGTAHLSGGEYAEAAEHFRRALGASEEVGDPYGRALTLHNLARLWSAVGDQEKATEFLDRSLRDSKLFNMRHLHLQNHIVRGLIQREQEEYTKAEGSLFRVLTAYSRQGNRAGLCGVLEQLSSVYRLMGSLQEASSTLEEARRYAEELSMHPVRVRCLCELSRQMRSADPPDIKGALRVLDQALEIVAKCDNAELAADIHYELAECLVSTREVAQAEKHFKAARDAYQEILEGLPADLRVPFERRVEKRFQNWSGSAASVDRAPPPVSSGRAGPAASGSNRQGVTERQQTLLAPEHCLRRASQLMMALPAAPTLARFLSSVVDEAIMATGAEAGFLLSLSGRSLSVRIAVERGGARPAQPGKHLSLPLIQRALTQDQALMLDASALGASHKDAGLLSEASCRSLAILPFLQPNGQKGGLYLVNPAIDPERTGAVALLLQPFLNLVAMAYLRFESSLEATR